MTDFRVQLHLRNFNEWDRQHSTFDAFPELVEQGALANALSSGIVNPILQFYGRGPAAFSELWAEHGHGDTSVLQTDSTLSSSERDGLITLRLYGTVPANATQAVENKNDARLLHIVNQAAPIVRANPDLSFEDEFESLRLGSSDQEISGRA